MSKTLKILILIASLNLAAPVQAGQYDTVFGQVQRMLGQSVNNDETGLNATRQQLEGVSRPAHQNVKEARALNQQGLAALKQNN